MDITMEPHDAVDLNKFDIVKFNQPNMGNVWVPIEKEQHRRILRMNDSNVYWATVVSLWKKWEASRHTRASDYYRLHPYDPSTDMLNRPTSEWGISEDTTPFNLEDPQQDFGAQIPFEPTPTSSNIAATPSASRHQPIQSRQQTTTLASTPKGRTNQRGKKRSAEVPTPTEFSWSDESIRAMLAIRFSKEDQFVNQSESSASLWKTIATELLNDYNYAVGPKVCHDKFRNLLTTYKLNKKKQKATGQGSEMVRWPYFDLFDGAFGHKAKFSVPKDHVASTLEVNNEQEPIQDHLQEQEEESVSRRGMSLAAYRKAKVGLLSAKIELEREKMQLRRDLEKERTSALIQTENAKVKMMEAYFNKNG